MNILEHIRQELPWLDSNTVYDLTRGKPASKQLDITQKYYSELTTPYEMDGIDLRNYGNPEGLPSARTLGSKILKTNFEETHALDNSSLSLMHQIISCAFFLGFKKAKLYANSKIICPVPGYDRHFKLLENFGIEMITVPFQNNGPDLNAIEDLLKKESNIHGIVCVPRHSNPTGHTFSDDNVEQLFELLEPLKDNFSIFWDNAYACHDIDETIQQTPADQIAKRMGLEDNLFQVSSTSKITLAGSGISFISSSIENLSKFIDFRNAITPGPNKMNQGMHVKYFESVSIEQQMNELKKIIKPKFELVDEVLKPLKTAGLCSYKKPTGGYFYSIDSAKNNADQIVQNCSELGLKLLPMGSCFPYGKDPDKKNIRLAPTFPDLVSLERCVTIFKYVLKYLN
jgi:DNA-binding transcriptional MocR family regulator